MTCDVLMCLVISIDPIQCCANLQFEVLLPPLYELVMEIEQKDIKGGQLLNLLHKRCHCGVPELQSCIQRYYLNYFSTDVCAVFGFLQVGFVCRIIHCIFYLHVSLCPLIVAFCLFVSLFRTTIEFQWSADICCPKFLSRNNSVLKN